MSPETAAFLLGNATATVNMTVGAGIAAILTVVCFKYGSSADSRTKDAVIARQLPPAPPVVVPLPVPSVPPQTPSGDKSAAPFPGNTTSGRASMFGGPDDQGVKPSDGLALAEPSEMGKFPGLFLAAQPPGTTGLARRLNPDALYIACRWDYKATPRSFLQGAKVPVSANGKTVLAQPIDWGPAESTGRLCDVSPGVMKALGIQTDDVVTLTIPLPFSAPNSGPQNGSGEPAWLTWARAEIGFHETGNNQGIGRYVQLAHCGAEGDPWCAIFANACLEASATPGTRSPAARSFCTHPAFTKVATPLNGDLAVFWRGSKDGGEGHVGFYVGEDAAHVQVLGGNEDDQVEIKPIPKNASTMGLLGYWRPNGIAVPKVT